MRKFSRIWVTRSQPGAEVTAGRLRHLGYEAVIQPVLEVQRLADVTPDLTGVDAIAFTSGAAISAFAALSPRRDFRVFTVGDATAALARAAGFSDVRSAAGDAAALASTIAASPDSPRQVLHPAAQEPAADLVALLAQVGIAARAQPVYRTLAAGPGRPPEAIDGVLVHSARAARRVAALVRGFEMGRVAAFALSPAVAEPLEGAGFSKLAVAAFPDEASLLNLLRD